MQTLHTSPRFGGSMDLYELADTPDGEPLGATHIGTVVAVEGGFTHGKAEGRTFESQGAALVDLAIRFYAGVPQHLLKAMPELLGADAFAEGMDKIYKAALNSRSALAAEKAKERWGSKSSD